MIVRVWHGWTTHALADTYDALLKTEIFPGILAKRIAGFQRIEMSRRDVGAETEFMTVMWFDSLGAVKRFVGDDYEAVYVPESARRVLARFDQRSAHYEVRATMDAPAA